MLSFADVTFYCNTDHDLPQQLISRQHEALGYAPHLNKMMQVQIVKHMNQAFDHYMLDGVPCYFFKGKNRLRHTPFAALKHLCEQKPDIVIIQGLIFPLQVLLLKMKLGKNSLIIVQHHGEKTLTRVQKILQKIADRYISAYVFTANGNAEAWVAKKMIRSREKCHEILEASTSFTKMDRQESRRRTGIESNASFLWVGRLDHNKDPMTVLGAFAKYSVINGEARLYMIFQQDQLLPDILQVIEDNPQLKKSVLLIGKIAHEELPYWYSAAAFYISSSHGEGSGYALLEAMSCGCVPIVTAIPSYLKITDYGRHGFLFEPADADSLFHLLNRLPYAHHGEVSGPIREYFENELSFRAIADKMHALCNKLVAEQVHNSAYRVVH